MKKHLTGAVTAALTFIIALAIGSPRLREPQHAKEPVQPALEITSTDKSASTQPVEQAA